MHSAAFARFGGKRFSMECRTSICWFWGRMARSAIPRALLLQCQCTASRHGADSAGIRTTGGTGGMRKAPKRGHRVTIRTCNHPGLPASRDLLPLEMLTYRLFIESPMRTQLAVEGFLAKFWYHRHPVLPHMSLTLPFFHGSSPGPGGAFLKGNYLPKNTHETAEPCECSPAVPVVNGKPILCA